MVIMLVETQRSMTDICDTGLSNTTIVAELAAPDHEARAATSGRPSLTVGAANSAMDSEARSSQSRTLRSRGVQERDLEKDVQHEVNLKESRATTSGQ